MGSMKIWTGSAWETASQQGPAGPVVLPAGGAAGSVLAKASSADYDVGWTQQVPKGLLARNSSTAYAVFTSTTGGNLPFNVATDATRAYRVWLVAAQATLSSGTGGADRWWIELMADGTPIGNALDIVGNGANVGVTSFSTLWFPTTGLHAIEYNAREIAGAATFTIAASVNNPTWLFVEDMGLR